MWPQAVMARVALCFPHSGPHELALLKRSFESYLSAVELWGPSAAVSMPSKAVDEVWHHAMLHSRFYAELCKSMVGWFVHHDPGPLPGARLWTNADADAELSGLARAWVGACVAEGIDWTARTQPSLFAADKLLGVEGGFTFSWTKTSGSGFLEPIQVRAVELWGQREPASKRSKAG